MALTDSDDSNWLTHDDEDNDNTAIAQAVARPWRILVVDDEPDIHAVTRLALNSVTFKGRGVEILSAYTGAQGYHLLATENGRVMVEQSPTKLLLANPDATRSDYVEGLGLTEPEFDFFRQVAVRSHRRFVVKQGEDFVPCELDLSGMPDDLAILSATPDNLRRLDMARADVETRFGAAAADDAQYWLPVYLDLVREAQRRTAKGGTAASDTYPGTRTHGRATTPHQQGAPRV